MSTLRAPAGHARANRPAGIPQSRPDTAGLRVVPQPVRRPARAPFMLLVAGLLAGGLIALLLLNTVLAQDAFVLHDLEKRSAALSDREQALQQAVAAAASPAQLAARARALGLVPSENPVFLRLSDGRVVGVPAPAKAPPKPKPSPKPSGSAGAVATPKAVPTPKPGATTPNASAGTGR